MASSNPPGGGARGKAPRRPPRNVPISQLREINEPIASLTPRSYEACMRCGIDPQTLQPAVLEDFLDGKTDKLVAEKMLQHVTRRREQNIGLVEQEKERYVREQERSALKNASHMSSTAGKSATGGELSAIGIAGPDSSTYLELERRRLEKIEYLRQKEMERMIEAERKTALIHARNAAREEKELAAKEEREAERRRRMDERAKKAAQIELEKKQKAEDDMRFQKEMAARLRNAEQRREQIQREEEELRRREAAKLRAEQQAAEMARRAELERREHEREEMKYRKLQQLRAAEQAVAENIERAKEERREALLAKRRAAEERIQKALSDSAARQEKIYSDFERKKREAEERQREQEEQERARKEEQAREREAHAAQKRARKEAVARAEQERVEALVAAGHDGQRVMDENRRRREHEIALRKLERDLRMADKHEVCERITKASEYRRKLVAHKIEEDDERAARIKAQREELIRQRKANQKEQITRKHQVMAKLEEIKVKNKWDEANQLGVTDGGKHGRKGRQDSSLSATHPGDRREQPE